MKMIIRPGDLQYVARRRALAMIKKAFDQNGIKFAYRAARRRQLACGW
jgi:hypothetical protein